MEFVLAMHPQDGIDVLASNILISHVPFPISIQVLELFGMAKSRGNFLLRLWCFWNRQSLDELIHRSLHWRARYIALDFRSSFAEV